MHAVRTTLGAIAIAVIVAAPAIAQTTIEVYGGVGAPRISRNGATSLPAAGPPILTSNPTFPSRQTSTWFLGDGAAMINDALSDFGVINRVAPLDSALSTLPFSERASAAFGVRMCRRFPTRFEIEAAVDVMPSRARATDALNAAAGLARSSFQDSFAALFATGPFVNTVVDATADVDGGSARRLSLTGALVIPLGAGRGLSPYLTVGGGMSSTFGTAPSVTLAGHYRTVARAGLPIVEVPLEEFDRATIRFQERTAPVGLAGAGVTRSFGDRWALRIDGRVLIGANAARVLLDATPSSTTGSPAGFIELVTFPSIEFSNNPSTERESSLSGSGLRDVTVFKGTGLFVQPMVTVGITFRLAP